MTHKFNQSHFRTQTRRQRRREGTHPRRLTKVLLQSSRISYIILYMYNVIYTIHYIHQTHYILYCIHNIVTETCLLTVGGHRQTHFGQELLVYHQGECQGSVVSCPRKWEPRSVQDLLSVTWLCPHWNTNLVSTLLNITVTHLIFLSLMSSVEDHMCTTGVVVWWPDHTTVRSVTCGPEWYFFDSGRTSRSWFHLSYNSWKDYFGKLYVHCSKFHQWLIHLHTDPWVRTTPTL
jgi:hypothetical protein